MIIIIYIYILYMYNYYIYTAAWSLRGEVYGTGHTLNLVYLDCDASYHDDIAWLHPLLVYVQVRGQSSIMS